MAVAQLACDIRTAGVNACPATQAATPAEETTVCGEPPTLQRCTCAPSRRCNVCIVVVILIYSPTLLVFAAAAEGAVEGYHGLEGLHAIGYLRELRLQETVLGCQHLQIGGATILHLEFRCLSRPL